MIDLHSHVLPGIDDGPETVAGSLAVLRAAAAAGIETMLATPHVNARFHNDAATIAGAAETLAGPAREAGVAVKVLLGAEVSITRVPELDPAVLPPLRLGDGPWMLLEPPFAAVAQGLQAILAGLQQDGYRVLIAHPERCPAFHREPGLLEALVRAGALSSLTAGSLVGRFGGEVKRFAFQILDAGLAHNVASDAHDAERRPPSIGAELRASGLHDLEDWLTREVPGAILAGGEVPPRPVGSRVGTRRRSWLGRARGRS